MDCRFGERLAGTRKQSHSRYVIPAIESTCMFSGSDFTLSEEFILSNASTSMTSLRKAVEVASNSCSFSPEGKLKWEIILTDVREREKLDEEQV